MCLGVPGRVIQADGLVATVDFWGVCREIRLDIVDQPVEAGDYILNHVGFAIRKIPSEEVEETLALYEELLRAAENDMMAADVRDELRASAARQAREGSDA
ncbi:MAG: HypC/HybG/HupF family hydrogenase formation chaperone [Gemmatimonadota bacterium]|nr:MAG: HypC/HybG/HupF family hydrogenase formation chaperone [Gemmatimonadota bacterium]